MSESYGGSLQENILTILCFSDSNANTIINNVDVNLFDNSFYRVIVEKSINYYNSFKEPPKQHLSDLLEKELKSNNAEIFDKIIRNIYELSNSINEAYVISELEKFVKTQTIKLGIKKSYELLQAGKLEEAEEVLELARTKKLSLFDPGVFFLKDRERTMSIFDAQIEDSIIYTGIKELDNLRIAPTKKELFILLGRSGAGKTWFLISTAVNALLQRKKVLHISLELSEEWLKIRYMMNLFALATYKEAIQYSNAVFTSDSFGNISNINFNKLKDVRILNESRDFVERNLDILYNPNLIIKEFPSSFLTIRGLKAYLDNLESYYNFIPDIILLDYLDLMSMDVENLRIDLGYTALALRGIAQERNVPMVTVAQSNRVAEGKKLLTRNNLAEDFSKVRPASNFITYNQTAMEEKYGLARIYVDKSNNSKEGSIILISQNKSIGQFHIDSALLKNDKYWNILEEKSKGE